METYAVYMEPRGGLASDIGSDTLFGAVCWALRLLDLVDLGTLLSSFEPPRFAFSSAFPCYTAGQEHVRFYPRPLSLRAAAGQVEQLAVEYGKKDPGRPRTALVKAVDRAKELHEVSFLSEEVFREVVGGQADALALLRRMTARAGKVGDLEQDGERLFSYKEHKRVENSGGSLRQMQHERAVQHNQVDRLGGATVDGLLYYVDEVSFSPGAGLWCLVRCSAKDLKHWVRPALRLLEDSGLGADRQSGKGQFRITVDDKPCEVPRAKSGTGWLSLSRYLPRPDELAALTDAKPLAYRLRTLWPKRERRFAHLPPGSQEVYKRRLRLFEPGSVFPLGGGGALRGRLVPVAPADEEGFTVYHSGLALGVSLQAQGE